MTMADNEKSAPGQGASSMELATSTIPASSGFTPEQKDALRIAHLLVDAGVPVFAAPRNHSLPLTAKMPFLLPSAWQTYRPRHEAVDRWRPGWMLAAVCGVQFDGLDTDVQNGGHITRAELEAAGLWPESFGTQRTPSGGTHDLIIRTHLPKGVPGQGIDLQAGADNGDSRGFLFIAPTVRVSKMTGEEVEYRWEVEPNLAALKAAEPSETHRKFLIHATKPQGKKSAPAPVGSAAVASGDDDLFTPAADTWTPVQAEADIAKSLEAIAAARQGEVNGILGGHARRIGRFVAGGYLTEEDAFQRIKDAVDRGGVHSDEWNAANGVAWSVVSVVSTAFGNALEKDGPFTVVESTNPHPYDSIAWHEHEAKASTTERRASIKDSLRSKLLNLKQLRDLPPAKPLIKGVLDLDSATWLIGQPGGFKSFVALDWACHVATGKAWDGHKTTEGDVIYVVAEGTKSFAKRVDAWTKHHAVEPERLLILPVAVQAKGGEGVSENWRALVEIVQEIQPSMVVLDTQARLTVGMEENSNTEMGVWVEAVDMVKRASGGCVLVVHHTGRNGGDARGASALDGAQDAEWKVERKPNVLECTLRMEKNKDGDDSQKWTYAMNVVELGTDEDGDPITSLVLGQEATPEDHSINGVVERLKAAGESLKTRGIISMVLETVEVGRKGMTRSGFKTALDQAMREAGQEAIKPNTYLSTVKRMVADGELFIRGTDRISFYDPAEDGEVAAQEAADAEAF